MHIRYTVQYIPLNKIKPGITVNLTKRIKELRKVAQDGMHMLIVRKSRKAGGYILISGNGHLEYLKKHTRKKSVPCLVDESKFSSALGSLIASLQSERRVRNSWSIINSFLKQEPRFRQLSRSQQLKVLRLGLQYKRTTISSMKAKVDELL